MNATPERPIPHAAAWSPAQRVIDMHAIVDRAAKEGWMHLIRPGFMAGTFGVTKDDVRARIRTHNELAGDGK